MKKMLSAALLSILLFAACTSTPPEESSQEEIPEPSPASSIAEPSSESSRPEEPPVEPEPSSEESSEPISEEDAADPDASDPPPPEPPVPEIADQLSMRVDPGESDDERIALVIANNSPQGATAGNWLVLEAYDGANWVNVPGKDGWGWTEEGYTIEPGAEITMYCHLEMYEVEEGMEQFRITKTITVGESDYDLIAQTGP